MTPNSTTTTPRPWRSARQPGIAGGGLDARTPRLRVRIGSPTSLLAVVPGLLGFGPGRSFVVIGTEPGSAQVRVMLRYNVPDPRHPRAAAALAGQAVTLLAAQGVTRAVAVGYGSDAAVSPVAAALRERAAAAGIAVTELLRADGGRYWSYVCRDPGCCPPEGTPFDITDHPAARALRAAGGRVLADRDALAATVAPAGGQQGAAMRRATRQVLGQVARCAARLDRAGMPVAPPRIAAFVGQVAVRDAICRYRAGGAVPAEHAALLTVALGQVRVRDDAWTRMDPGHQGAHLRLWTDMTRLARPGYVAAPAALLAFVAWQAGDGALANVALDRALADNARYTMALLLRDALDSGAPPSMARLPMTPEEVEASYDAAEAAEDAAKAAKAEKSAVPAGEAGETDLPRPDTLPEPSARPGAELAPFGYLCASWSRMWAGPGGSGAHAVLRSRAEEEHVTGISGLPPAKRAAHEAAVTRLREAYAAVPDGVAVRLAKPTSNLFRFRDPASAAQRVSLDVSAFARVIHVDPASRTAVVGGMTTYEDLCDATLPHGLMPLVVPELKTITLGGAVTGLGIEATSVWHGLPHESVTEMELLTGDGRVVIATGDNEHSDLFRGFPNSYGTLGYTLALTIELMPVKPYVHVRHFAFSDPKSCMDAIAEIARVGSYQGHRADFLDGVAFGNAELYLSVGAFSDKAPWLSDYTRQEIYYQSLRTNREDFLTVKDYIWRWDTDWFWCAGAFGLKNKAVRRLWPRRYRRSDVYRKFVALDQKYGLTAAMYARRHWPQREFVTQDVEIPVERGHEFLEFFAEKVKMTPVWMCPVRLRGTGSWTLYPMHPGDLYVNFGFWGTAPLPAGQGDGYYNRMVEEEVSALGGHKSLYSTAFYPEDEFRARYNGAAYDKLKAEYDGGGRLLSLYDKAVRRR